MSIKHFNAFEGELSPPFTVVRPRSVASPFVFCSPHSGAVYPRSFLASARLGANALRKSEDCYVDELFSAVSSLGAPLIAARFPRAFVDVNREPYELDPELFNEALPSFANTQSVRVVGGLGTIARIVADGEEIYRERMTVAEAMARIDRLYKPFHDALASLLDETRRTFGIAILIDCHSMPSSSIGQPTQARPDIVLGDRFGVSCDGRLTRFLREQMQAAGFEVHLNRPYAGGYITENYGKPVRGFHALQIELNRALYMDEGNFRRTANFPHLQKRLGAVMAGLMAGLPDLLNSRAAAAE
jgi:N-formylglutamate amidohydrolase